MRRALVWYFGAVTCCLAETVTIAPGNGVFTNVMARITGEADVEINTGTSGGGRVRLNPANGYVGTSQMPKKASSMTLISVGEACGTSTNSASLI